MIRQIAPQFFTMNIPGTLAYYRDKLGFHCLGTWQDPPVYFHRCAGPACDSLPMWCWTINLTRGTVREEKLDERAVEFPRIDDRLVGVPARYRVTVGTGISYATISNAVLLRSIGSAPPPGDPGEAAFAPAHSHSGELSGRYLS